MRLPARLRVIAAAALTLLTTVGSASADALPLAGDCAHPIRTSDLPGLTGVVGKPTTLQAGWAYMTWYADCDQPGDPYTATVDWGDGTPPSAIPVLTGPSGVSIVAAHTYAQPTVTVPGDLLGDLVTITWHNERTGLTYGDVRNAVITLPATTRRVSTAQAKRHKRHRALRRQHTKRRS
jgi:hypothetical protein